MHATLRAELRIIQCSAYHGVLAPCASARDRIVPGPRLLRASAGPEAKGPSAEAIQALAGTWPPVPKARHRADDSASTDPGPATQANGSGDLDTGGGAPATDSDRRTARRPLDPDPSAGRPSPRRLPWAELLQRVFELDALRCPRCGAPMRWVSAIEDPEVARKILECLDLAARAPPLGPVSNESVWHASESWDEDARWAVDQTQPDGDDVIPRWKTLQPQAV